ncbi:MAG: four helix bundle protein [Saprospiraceae bacterium]|uniref:Four helix bundle protein n=1 Tax=Candidatus Opimibacter skivensis TaxID=2982028 RepID=A0A9D7STQ8_9BACT|nr:four helix bundle protein [Candidatus Opimibacter skivensis]
MFLKLAHTNLDVYKYSYALILEAYRVTKILPADERFNLVSQLRRAALSVHLNIAEGSSRKSMGERKRFYEIARGSLIEVDTAIGVAFGLEYVTLDQVGKLGEVIINSFKVLTGLIDKNKADND